MKVIFVERFGPSPKKNAGYTIILYWLNSTNFYYFVIIKENKMDKAVLKLKKLILKTFLIQKNVL